jgi:hypothetical protein
MVELPHTRFIVITGGIDSDKEREMKSRKLMRFLAKDSKAVVVKFDNVEWKGKKVFLMRNFVVGGRFRPSRLQEALVRGLDPRLDAVSSLKEIKRYILEVEAKRKPDFLLIETNNNLEEEKNRLIFKAIEELVKSEGKPNFLFIHLALTPELEKEALLKEKAVQSKEILDQAKVKPDLIIEGLEIKWLH